MMQRRLLLSAAVAAPVVLSGCASQSIDGYASEKPVLDLAQYFNGTIDAHGIFQDRGGRIVKRFTVVMDCEWKANGASRQSRAQWLGAALAAVVLLVSGVLATVKR